MTPPYPYSPSRIMINEPLSILWARQQQDKIAGHLIYINLFHFIYMLFFAFFPCMTTFA